MAGTTIGRYRLIERIGHGAMADVFKAKSFGVEGFEKTLVVKRIAPELAAVERFANLFVQEAKLALRLSHANVVQMFDLGLAPHAGKPVYFIAMEYVAGLDLGKMLARCRELGSPLPMGMCVFIATEVTKALDHAHRRRDEQLRPLGILHGDVRPSNILLSWEGEVKVADFGLARAWEGLDPARGIENVPPPQRAYLSPEQVAGEPLDARTDLFSLGTVLYELLTFALPFAAETADATLARIAACEYAPVESRRKDMPGDLAGLVERMLARAPERRFPDAGRLHESLLSHLYGSSDRFGSKDLATFLARLRDVPSLPPSILPVAEEHDRAPRDASRQPTLEPESLGPPAVEPALLTSDKPAGETEPTERRVVSLLLFELGSKNAEVLSARRTRLEPIVVRYGGRLIRGDRERLIAVFGARGAKPTSTEMAVRCALCGLRQMATAGEGPLSPGTHELGEAQALPRAEVLAAVEPSAGVHTGWARMHRDGTPVDDEAFQVLLETAMQMARLRFRSCGLSLSAARKVRGQFVFDAPGEASNTPGLVIRDLKAPVDVHGRFVGRKTELKLLGEVLSQATRKRTHVVTLVGHPGTGKTRLLVETRRRLQRGSYRVGFYLATCRSDGRSIPLSGLAEMLSVLSGIQTGDPPEHVLELEPRFRALGLHDDEVAGLLGLLGAPTHGGTGLDILTTGFARTVISLCSEQLQIFAWDNAQAIDNRSLEVIRAVTLRMAPSRAVFLLVGRDIPSTIFDGHPNHHRLVLGDLGDAETRELIAHRMGARVAPEELFVFCRARAGGNPLHIEELLRNLVDSGVLARAGEAVAGLRLPDDSALQHTPEELLLDRSRRLSEDERRTVEAAAVLGDPTQLDILAQMVGAGWPELEKIVDGLEERAILRRTGASTVAFVSPLLREVLLEALPADRRHDMHEAAARGYEHVLGERALEQVDRLAAHLLEAGAKDRAAVVHAEAARRASTQGRYEPAARFLSRALALADFDRQSAADLALWLHDLASLVYRARSAPGISELAEPLMARIDAHAAPALQVQARIDLASILVSTHDFDAADRYLESAGNLAKGDAVLLAATLLTQAELLRRQGDFLRSLKRYEELVELAPKDPSTLRRMLVGLSICCAATGDEARALATLDSASQPANGDGGEGDLVPYERSRVRLMIALFAGDFQGAIAEGERAVALAKAAGLTYEVALSLNLLGQALFRAGERAHAYGCLQQSTALCDEASEERLRAHSRAFVAYLEAKANVDAARVALQESIQYASSQRYLWDEANGRYLLARLQREQGYYAAAQAEFEGCRALCASTGYRLVGDDCTRALAEMLAPMGAT